MSKKDSGSWTAVSDILKHGAKGRPVVISKPPEFRTYLRALFRFMGRHQRFAHLFIADPHRLLRALGVELAGDARERFDKARELAKWKDEPAEYDKIAAAKAPVSSGVAISIDEASLETVSKTAANPAPESELGVKIGQLEKAVLKPVTPGPISTPPPKPPPLEPVIIGGAEGHSHEAALDFKGVTDEWDVVVQLHGSFFERMYELFFAAQTLGSFGQLGTEFVDTRYRVEGWLLKLYLFEITVDGTIPRTLVFHTGEADTVGVRMGVKLKLSSRWSGSDPWEFEDEYSAVFTRFGKVTKQESVQLGDAEMKQVFAADLMNGFTEIEPNKKNPLDDTQAAFMEVALDNYFRDEMPFLVVSNEFVPDEPFVSWARAACFTNFNAPDMNVVTLAFGAKARSNGTSSDPYRHYIMHHGRNITVALSDQSIVFEVLASLPDTPHQDQGVTIEQYTAALREGYIEVVAKGFKKFLVKVGFTYTVKVLLRLDSKGNLTSVIEDTDLGLPWWLWALSFLFASWSGLVALSIVNVVLNKKAQKSIAELVNVNEDLSSLFSASLGGLQMTAGFDKIETNSTGVFIRGDLEIK